MPLTHCQSGALHVQGIPDNRQDLLPSPAKQITPLLSALPCLQSPIKGDAPAKAPRARRASKANAARTGGASLPARPMVASGMVSMYSAGLATPATAAAQWGVDLIVAAVSASLEELLQLDGIVNEQAMALEPSRVGVPAQVQHKAPVRRTHGLFQEAG